MRGPYRPIPSYKHLRWSAGRRLDDQRKIGELHGAVAADEDVVGAHVAMYEREAVHVPQCLENATQNAAYLPLGHVEGERVSKVPLHKVHHNLHVPRSRLVEAFEGATEVLKGFGVCTERE